MALHRESKLVALGVAVVSVLLAVGAVLVRHPWTDKRDPPLVRPTTSQPATPKSTSST